MSGYCTSRHAGYACSNAWRTALASGVTHQDGPHPSRPPGPATFSAISRAHRSSTSTRSYRFCCSSSDSASGWSNNPPAGAPGEEFAEVYNSFKDFYVNHWGPWREVAPLFPEDVLWHDEVPQWK